MPTPSADDIRTANVRYHDLAAAHYDSKWGISFEELGQSQVAGKLHKALGEEPGHYASALEIGAGTGYFGLNLVRAGIVERLTATDISPGMLAVLASTARDIGVDAETACCQATELPFADESFDLVLGHAVLHHLPHLDDAFDEFRRVLAPGGTIAFCGEPSHYGDRLAVLPKRGAHAIAPLWRALMRAPARRNGSGGPERGGPARGSRRCPRVHALRPRRPRPRGGLRAGARERRGAGGQPVRLGQPLARVAPPSRRRSRGPGGSTPTAAT